MTALLAQHGMSVRQLAAETGVSPSYLSQLLRGVDYKHRPSTALAQRVSLVFRLAPDYFGEYREQVVCERVRDDPELRDRMYRLIKRKRRG